jgi:hypothetical protein
MWDRDLHYSSAVPSAHGGRGKSVKPQAVVVSPLSLLMLWIFALHVQSSFPTYDFAVFACFFNG